MTILVRDAFERMGCVFGMPEHVHLLVSGTELAAGGRDSFSDGARKNVMDG
jgi:hypothetical protein